MPPWRHSCPDRPAIDSYYPMMWPRTTYRPCPALPGEPHLEKTMAKSHPVREQTQWACVVRARVPLSQGGRCGGSSCQMRSPCLHSQGNRIWKKRWQNPTPSGNKHNGHALSGHGFPFPKVVVAVGRHAKCGHLACTPRGTASGKNDGGFPPRPGTNTMGMRCPGTSSPFPRWALRWVVMPNAVTLPALLFCFDTC